MDIDSERAVRHMAAVLDYLAGLGHRNANGGLKYPGRSESIADHKAYWRHVVTMASEAAKQGRKALYS